MLTVSFIHHPPIFRHPLLFYDSRIPCPDSSQLWLDFSITPGESCHHQPLGYICEGGVLGVAGRMTVTLAQVVDPKQSFTGVQKPPSALWVEPCPRLHSLQETRASLEGDSIGSWAIPLCPGQWRAPSGVSKGYFRKTDSNKINISNCTGPRQLSQFLRNRK